jgi:O-antigen ligase
MLPWAGIGLLCLISGAALATGSTRTYLVVAVPAGLAAVLLMAELGFASLPIWAVVGTIAYPFVRFPASHAVVTWDRLWIGAMVGCLILRSRPLAGRSRAARSFTIAFAWLAISFLLRAALTGNGRTGNVETALDAVVLPLILFLVTRREAFTIRRTERLALGLGVAGLMLAIIGIAERVFGFDLASRVGGASRFDVNVDLVRVSGPYAAPEPYALALLICLAATMYWLQRRRAYWLGSALVGIQLIAIALTLFRTAWVGALIIVVASLGLRPKRYGRLFTVLGLVLALLVVTFGQLQQNTAFKTRVNNTSNGLVRIATYEEGWQLFTAHPLFGVGVNQFPNAVQGMPELRFNGAIAEPYPHSSYVGALSEQGVWGFIPLLVVTFATAMMLRRYRRRARGPDQLLYASVIGAVIAYLLMSVTLTMLPYGPSNDFFAVILGMVAARLDSLDTSPQASLSP